MSWRHAFDLMSSDFPGSSSRALLRGEQECCSPGEGGALSRYSTPLGGEGFVCWAPLAGPFCPSEWHLLRISDREVHTGLWGSVGIGPGREERECRGPARRTAGRFYLPHLP